MNAAFGLHRLPEPELKRLLRALHRGALPSPITRSSLIEKAFGHIEGHLDLIVGRDVAAAKALVVAVLAERGSERGPSVQLSYSGVPVAGTRSRDLVDQARELLATAKQSAHLYGLGVGDDRGLLATINSLIAGRDITVRLVFDGDGLIDPVAEVRAFSTERLRAREGLELFVSVRHRLRARVLVVDETRVLVTSGALTGQEEDGFVDAGVLVDDVGFARAWGDEWARLRASGCIEAVPLVP
jgi:hypothetical protein